MTSKFEQLIEFVINDEEQKAKELFHDIVVEKSREIYETLMDEAEEELEVSYIGDTLDIGFNVTYLIDVLNNTNSEKATFSFADANSSCLITLPNDADYKYVVMPMRI